MTGALSILSCEQICFKCSLSTGNIWSQSTPVRAAKGNKYTCSTCKSWNNVIGQEIRGAIPPLTQYAFIVWCSVKNKTQGQPYLYLYIYIYIYLYLDISLDIAQG